MRVTSKGQVTIPKQIRDRLGIAPGSEVEFLPTEDGARLVAVNENISEAEASRRFMEAGWHGRYAGSRRYDHG